MMKSYGGRKLVAMNYLDPTEKQLKQYGLMMAGVDRKSVVQGKSVDLGGRRIIKKISFFQAEDGIRDWSVTGVQTCALPIC